MTLHAPQLLWICLASVSFGISCCKHGQPKNTNYNIFVDLMSTGLAGCILYWGGFFG